MERKHEGKVSAEGDTPLEHDNDSATDGYFTDLLTENHIIPDDHLVNICKYRKGNSCCKYIIYSDVKQNFCCVKNIQYIKNMLDSQELKAQGDNCVGLPCEDLEKLENIGTPS